MIEKIKKELEGLPDHFVVGLVVSSKNYDKTNIALIKYLLSQENSIGSYITVNRSYSNLSERLKKEGIATEKLFFIDCISKRLSESIRNAENCVFVEGPTSLTDISIAMHEYVVHSQKHPGRRFLFIDSLSTLALHNNIDKTFKFVHYLSGKIRMWGLAGVMIALQEEDHRLITHISQFCDKIIDVD